MIIEGNYVGKFSNILVGTEMERDCIIIPIKAQLFLKEAIMESTDVITQGNYSEGF